MYPLRDKKSKTPLVIGLLALITFFVILGAWWSSLNKTGGNKELKLQEQAADVIKTKDFSQCEKINDATYKTVCVNNIALNLAKETQDISYCQKIDDKLIPKADCERQVVFAKSLEKENIAVCKETRNAEIQKQCEDGFYNQLALKKNDIKACDQNSEKDNADFCYNSFLVTKNFTESRGNFDCSLLRGEEEQGDCEQYKNILGGGSKGFASCVNLKTNLFVFRCHLEDRS